MLEGLLSYLLFFFLISFGAYHPISLGLMVLVSSCVVSCFLMALSSLYGFCVFMVMVGGVLVVFCYTLSLVPLSVDGNQTLFDSKGVKSKSKFWYKSGEAQSEEYYLWSSLVVSVICFYMGFIGDVYGVESVDSNKIISQAMYFSGDWGVFVAWMGVVLFCVMIFCVNMAGKYKGALVK